MTEDRLLQLIEAWGADPEAFPETERAAAKALLAASPERFTAALTAARAIDAALDAVPQVLPSKALEDALIASAPTPRSGRAVLRLPKLTPWAPASGFAALAAGLFMGAMIAPAASATSDTEEMATVLEHALGYDPAAFTEELGE
ncbi:MAG: hypothetical protein ACK4HR_03415 [Hyphomonas sp.]|jgi:hypothetical protein